MIGARAALSVFALLVACAAVCAGDAERYTLRSAVVLEEPERFDTIERWRPSIDTTVFVGLVRDLRLDGAQRMTARELYDAFTNEHVRNWTEHAERSRDEGLRAYYGSGDGEHDNDAYWAARREVQDQYESSADALARTFLDDLALMTTDDPALWERARESMRTRVLLARAGGVPHDGYFLPDLVERLDVDDATHARLRPTLELYREELATALAQRGSALGALFPTVRAYDELNVRWNTERRSLPGAEVELLMAERREAGEGVKKRVFAAMPACERVAGLNRAYRDRIADELDPDNAELLRAMFRPIGTRSRMTVGIDDSEVAETIDDLLRDGASAIGRGARGDASWRASGTLLERDPVTPDQRDALRR
ncbi:MAG: hypothetical protein AAGH64_08665, partial [Planctomycetota bacterium]